MSYRSRLYNHRNAQSVEGNDKPFFSKKQKENDSSKKSTFFQAKLEVNKPGDKYEQEADVVASKVVANKTSKAERPPAVQRLSTEEESKMPSTNDGRMAEDKRIQEKPMIQKMGADSEKEKMKGIQKMELPEKKKEEGMPAAVQKMSADPEKEKMKGIQKMELPEKKKEEGMPAAVQKVSADPEKEKMKGIQKMELPEKKKEEGTTPLIQKMSAAEQEKEKPGIQKMDAPLKEEKDKKGGTAIQKKTDAAASTATPKVASKIENTSGKGNTLPQKTLHEMNASFGRDFSNVNIHSDSEATDLNEELQAKAFTHGRDIYFNQGKFDPESAEGKFLLAHELTHVVQQGASEKENSVQRDSKAAKKSMLDQFAEKFPDSIDIIKKSPEALLLIKEASDAGVEFGGYAEEGPSKDTWAYTTGSKVYVPKAHKNDKITAARDFLFELNNGIHSTALQAVHTEAGKGSKGSLDAKTYAKKKVEIEVDGMLRLGKVWVDMKKNKPKGENWDAHDGEYYLSQYEDYKAGKKTKDDIVKDVLQTTYTEGNDAGKTVEQYYMDQYNDMAKGK